MSVVPVDLTSTSIHQLYISFSASVCYQRCHLCILLNCKDQVIFAQEPAYLCRQVNDYVRIEGPKVVPKHARYAKIVRLIRRPVNRVELCRYREEQAAIVSSLKTGDKVVTTSGIHGLISNVKDKTVIVKIADNVKIEMEKSAVTAVVKAE